MTVNGEIIIFIVKLVLCGFAAFFAILLLSRKRDFPCISLVTGTIIQYLGILFDLLSYLGIVSDFLVAGKIPVIELILSILPPLCFIIAFISMLHRSGR